ncbi:MAG: hypothetical protein IJU58_01280 [Clostridia bacterium]|nr:hypothetical protein [Clostridia bacterium]
MEENDNLTQTQPEIAEPNADVGTTAEEPASDVTPAPQAEVVQTSVDSPVVQKSIFNEDEPIATPGDVAKKMHTDHFAVIMNKLAIFAMIASILIMIGQVVAFVAAGLGIFIFLMFLIVITVGTMGIVLLDPTVQRWWGYIQHFDEVTDKIKQVFDFLYMILPYLAAVGIVGAVISLICFGTNKAYAHPTRKVMAIISIVVLVFAFIFGLRVMGGAA